MVFCKNKIIQVRDGGGCPCFSYLRTKQGFMVLSIMEELLKVDVVKQFLKSNRVGSKAFIIKRSGTGLGVIWLWEDMAEVGGVVQLPYLRVGKALAGSVGQWSCVRLQLPLGFRSAVVEGVLWTLSYCTVVGIELCVWGKLLLGMHGKIWNVFQCLRCLKQGRRRSNGRIRRHWLPVQDPMPPSPMMQGLGYDPQVVRVVRRWYGPIIPSMTAVTL